MPAGLFSANIKVEAFKHFVVQAAGGSRRQFPSSEALTIPRKIFREVVRG